MTQDLTNYIRFDGNKLTGNIATLSFDIDITGTEMQADNDKAPVFRLYAMSPRGRKIDVGGIWQRTNSRNEPYYALSINAGHGRWFANLGRYPGQDDDALYAVIPNGYLNNGDRRS
ncbi:DUF736 family protein [Xanthobacter sp. V13C-7B]|uniref:DUF736 domain-containing protein n=1 Tax=Xanthobacter variabilis TaxID=3119932 RepID=UPI00372B0BF4